MCLGLTLLKRQLDLYPPDTWRAEHALAMRCRDLEDVIDYGLSLLANIHRQSDRCAKQLESHADQSAWEISAEFAEVYRAWLAGSRPIIEAAEQLESRGYKVEQADELRLKVRELALYPLDIEKLRAGYEAGQQGNVIPLEQAMDELRAPRG